MSTVYVVGGGLAGLSAAVLLAEKGAKVELIEGAPQAGGRCRSYFDPVLEQVIDNGNHLVLSGNHSVRTYLRTIGADGALTGPDRAEFNFADVNSGARWTIRPNEGPLAWWIFSSARRVPGSHPADYLTLLRLLIAGPEKKIGDVIACEGPLWDRLLQPFLLAALNTEPKSASAALAGAVIRESLAKGGHAYHPRIAHPTLAAVFVDPALDYLKRNVARVRIGQRVRALTSNAQSILALQLPDGTRHCDPRRAAARRNGIGRGPRRTHRFPFHRERPFQDCAAGGRALDDRRDWRRGGVDFRFSRPHLDHRQRRRCHRRPGPRGAGAAVLGGRREGLPPPSGATALADRQGTPCDLCRHATASSPAAKDGYPLAQPVARG